MWNRIMLVRIMFNPIMTCRFAYSLLVKLALPENNTYEKNIGFRIFYTEFIDRIEVCEQNHRHLTFGARTHDTIDFLLQPLIEEVVE